MAQRKRIGVLTPSSNTVLEPLTQAMLAGLPEVSAHFARFTVTEIGLSAGALAQFDDGPILAAARLLADARVDAIAWSGTSSSWLGFDRDRALCARITEATGIPATTSVLAINDLLARQGARRIGLASPYTADVQQQIITNYRGLGIETVAESHLDISVNYAFGEVETETLATMLTQLAKSPAKPEALVVMCTNLRAAPRVEALEASLKLPIYDSVATAVWQALQAAGVDTRRVKGWGGLFNVV